MVNNMYFLASSIILIGYAILTLAYTIKNREIKIENNIYANEILIVLLFFLKFHSYDNALYILSSKGVMRIGEYSINSSSS